MNLYQLANDFTEQATSLADLDLDEQTIADTLEGMMFPVEVKATNVAAFVLNLESDVAAIKSAEEKLAARRQSIEKRAKHLRDYLKSNMVRCGISEITANDKTFAIKLKQNPESVKVEDETAIPASYFVEKVSRSLDKTLVKAAIKNGAEVPGCHLERGTRLEIR
jgi:predicted transcriptional regulator